MSSVSESPKKHVLYPSTNQPSASSKASPPKASHHHMPKVTLPKVHASQIQTSNQHQYYSLRWNNYQKCVEFKFADTFQWFKLISFSNLTDMFHELLNAEKFVDVTLACENSSLKCHKVRNEFEITFLVLSFTQFPSFLLGRAFSMFIIFPKTSHRKSLQASNHHHATRGGLCRSSVHHWVCLSRRDRRFWSGIASE